MSVAVHNNSTILQNKLTERNDIQVCVVNRISVVNVVLRRDSFSHVSAPLMSTLVWLFT